MADLVGGFSLQVLIHLLGQTQQLFVHFAGGFVGRCFVVLIANRYRCIVSERR